MGLMPQEGTTNNKEDEMQIKDEEIPNEEFPEQHTQTEITSSSEDSEQTERSKNEEATNMPIKGSVKWESLAHQPESVKSPIDGERTS